MEETVYDCPLCQGERRVAYSQRDILLHLASVHTVGTENQHGCIVCGTGKMDPNTAVQHMLRLHWEEIEWWLLECKLLIGDKRYKVAWSRLPSTRKGSRRGQETNGHDQETAKGD